MGPDEGTTMPLCYTEKKVQHIISTHQTRSINCSSSKLSIHFSSLCSLTFYGVETEQQVEHKHVTAAKRKIYRREYKCH